MLRGLRSREKNCWEPVGKTPYLRSVCPIARKRIVDDLSELFLSTFAWEWAGAPVVADSSSAQQ